jgi:hypothetical protein
LKDINIYAIAHEAQFLNIKQMYVKVTNVNEEVKNRNGFVG